MSRGGARPGAGRKPGSVTRRTREIAEQAAVQGITPLEFLLQAMRDESREFPVRLDAAKAAAPYVHAKLAAVEVTGKDGGPVDHSLTVEFINNAGPTS